MIVAREAGAYRLVTQPDHARLAGEMLALWRGDGLPANPRRSELIFAGREHDNGWWEADAAPRCDEAGRPVDFAAMPRQERIEIWERGTARFLEERLGRPARPYAALLIVRHARELHRAARRDAGWRDFVRRLATLERRLRRELGAGGRALAADYRLLNLADTLALAACAGWTRTLALPGLDARLVGSPGSTGAMDATDIANAAAIADAGGAATLLLSPLPLAGATTFRVPCRRIPLRPYRGDADLGGELAAARWQELRVRLTGMNGDDDEG
jgi:hypothetical protein